MAGIAVELVGVSKRYRIYHRRHQTLKELVVTGSRGVWTDLWALRDVNLQVPAGQMLGVVGANGVGKSTMLRLLARIGRPDQGEVRTSGRVACLLELGAGFQPQYTGRENVELYGVLLGLSRRQVRDRFDDIVDFSGLAEFIDHPIKDYSSGMQMRLGFAVAALLDPDVLLLDEVLAVGDAAFQESCFTRLRQLREAGTTVVLVSHELDQVRQLCERAVWLDGGRVAADGPPDQVLMAYLDTAGRRRDAELVVSGFGKPTGEVEVAAVRWVDATGRPALEHETGDDLALEIECRTPRSYPRIAVSVHIYRSDGVLCAHQNSDVDRMPLRLDQGGGVIELRFPGCSLRSGIYDVNLAIYEPLERRMLAFHHRRHPFQVQDGDGYGGVAELRHEWHQAGAVADALD